MTEKDPSCSISVPGHILSVVKQNATPDSSFWINAHRAGLLPHVLGRYELWYAPAVAAELDERFSSGREFWMHARAGHIMAAIPSRLHLTDFGPGERAAISLAIEHPDWLLLLDDLRPFRAASVLRLSVICTPVLVVTLLIEGVLTEVDALAALARLAALQTVSPHLLAAALAQLAGFEKK